MRAAGWLGWAVLVLTVVAAAGYWAIVLGQDTPLGPVPFIVSGLLLASGGGSALGSSKAIPAPLRAILLGWSALTLLALASIAFSIGAFLLPIALVAIVAMLAGTWSERRGWGIPGAALGGVLGVATIVAFVSVEPYLPPTCPNHQPGLITGSTDYPAGLLTPAVHISWSCEDGRLVTWRTS
jgi:hypothetical protein